MLVGKLTKNIFDGTELSVYKIKMITVTSY